TARVCPRATRSPHRIFRAPSYSSSAVAAGNSASGSSSRIAVRRARQPRKATSRSPVNRTPPCPGRTPFAPMPRSSVASASSAPRGQVAYQERNTPLRLPPPRVGREHLPPRRHSGQGRQRQLHHRQITELGPEELAD